MTQQTRNTIANVLLGVSVLLGAVFVAQHFMTASPPSWHKDLVWLALAAMIVSPIVRGSARRRTMQNAD